MNRSIYDNREDREEAISELINAANHNPLLTDELISAIYTSLSAEISLYIDIGINTLHDKVQNMIDTDHPLKSFFMTPVNVEQTLFVKDSLFSGII